MPTKIIFISVFVLITFFKLSSAQEEKPKPNPTPYQDWDYLVFTQRWPVTACLEWQLKSKAKSCNMPPQDTWIVHGLWPTKNGFNGPYFCDSAIHFDVDEIDPILEDLKANWTNIEDGTKPYSLWKHEWSKHGTCGVVLPQLNSVTNYFSKALELQEQYNIYKMLSNNNITAESDSYYSIQNLYDTVRNELNKEPTIECLSYEKKSYISEVRICFNKTFDLIDCNSHDKIEEDVLSNCNLKRPVFYLNKLNSSEIQEVDQEDDRGDNIFNLRECFENSNMRENLLNLYRMLKFTIWFTL